MEIMDESQDIFVSFCREFEKKLETVNEPIKKYPAALKTSSLT